jgi:ATP-binding cassette subfamily B protein/subfamily B ATP-binding cassette protein MsbA
MRTDADTSSRVRGYRRLCGYAAPYRRGWVTIVATTLLSTALSVLQPWPIKVLVDHVLGDTPMRGSLAAIERLPWAGTRGGLLGWVVLAGILLFVVNSVVEVVLSLQWTRVGRRMVYQLARDLFARVQRRSLRAHTRHPVGDPAYRQQRRF